MNPRNLARFLVPVVLVLSTALLLQARGSREVIAPRQELAGFPTELDGRSSREIVIGQDVRDILGPGDFLNRFYFRPDQPYIDFFVAYFASQRTGKAIHSPKNCLPGSGWTPTDSGYVQIRRPDGTPVTVNRYVIGKGLERQIVLYWYQAHDRVVASEYWAKYFLVADAITMNRSDGALVRVITPVNSQEGFDKAQARAVRFAETAFANLGPYIPR